MCLNINLLFSDCSYALYDSWAVTRGRVDCLKTMSNPLFKCSTNFISLMHLIISFRTCRTNDVSFFFSFIFFLHHKHSVNLVGLTDSFFIPPHLCFCFRFLFLQAKSPYLCFPTWPFWLLFFHVPRKLEIFYFTAKSIIFPF